ncbi:MAG: HAMP domain-containing histidine kinase, partial [Gammaproteobacteria bacterium]|nr:HAMP domain-containing histidine kinase [Gammaproteobacteria bacterium]
RGKTNTTEDIIPLDNTSRIMLSTKAPLYNDADEIIGIIGVSVDITELKETQDKLVTAQITAEKEQEMRKTVMTLVGDIVHDLKTPIATINTATHILDTISPGLKELINEAQELKSKKLASINSKKLDYVVNKMSGVQKDSIRFMSEFIKATLRELSIAQKYHNGEISLEALTKCSSRRVLENVMESYPRHENIIINQCFPYDFFFMGNSILMMKVLYNLIRNAEEQIIANGKGEITITTKETENANLLIVKDTAGGASPEVVENMFKEFFTTKKDGAGIGLPFCKKMMLNFGGDLTCRSISGDSIEFILSFPKITNTTNT